MSDMKTATLAAAERRIKAAGFGGFSCRDIAADVSIKGSSVHYHFPTKEDLGAAVIRRWGERTFGRIDEAFAKDPDPARVWAKAFRRTAQSDAGMCPCVALGPASQELPKPVAAEVKAFFKTCRAKMAAQGLSS